MIEAAELAWRCLKLKGEDKTDDERSGVGGDGNFTGTPTTTTPNRGDLYPNKVLVRMDIKLVQKNNFENLLLSSTVSREP